jgi:hypothetical protein
MYALWIDDDAPLIVQVEALCAAWGTSNPEVTDAALALPIGGKLLARGATPRIRLKRIQ